MVEPKPQENGSEDRNELVQQFLEKMFSMMKQIHREIGPHDALLSPPQARLVFTIAHYRDKGISVKDLAQMAHMTPGAITQFIDALIKKGLVRREEDPVDRRIVRLKLNPDARAQMESYRKAILTAAACRFDVLSLEELKQLNDLLLKVSPESFIHENHDC